MPAGLKQRAFGAAKIAVPIIASIAAIVFVGQIVDWPSTFASALRAPIWAIAAGLTLVWLQLALCGLRMSVLAKFAGAPLGWGYSSAVWTLGFLGGLLLPTSVGAEVVKGVVLAGRTRLPARVIGILALERIMALAAMLVLILLTLPFSAGRFFPEYSVALTGLAIATLIVGALALFMRAALARGLLGLLKVLRVPASTAEIACRMLETAPVGRTLALSFAIHLLTMAAIAVLFVGFAVPAPVESATIGGPLVTFASLLPISVGGFGVREAAFIVVFDKFGVAASLAAAIALAWWGIQALAGLAAATVGGLWLFADGQISRRSASARNATAEDVSVNTGGR